MRQRHFVVSIFKELGEHAAFVLPDLVLLAKSDDSHAVASAEEILDSLHEQCSSAERGQRTRFHSSYCIQERAVVRVSDQSFSNVTAKDHSGEYCAFSNVKKIPPESRIYVIATD